MILIQQHPAYLLIFLAYVLGGGSLVLFGAFCYIGSLHLVRLGLNESGTLLLDTCLSLTFFLQHSGMVRKPFRRYVAKFIPETYTSAVYAICSGFVLLTVIIFWQGTTLAIATADSAFRLLLRATFLASIAGFIWGTKVLGFFDPLGIRGILKHIHGKKPKEMPMTVKGPYRWVRHPLYLFVLVMIWSCPDLTLDRLLFNILWTVWIYLGALLEERDLVEDFGETYRQYQSKVPMLIPYRVYPSWPA
jgi:protein-S-isoprenylcysteine O-methyltransferase Ste14